MDSTSTAMQSQNPVTNATDLCLYLSFMFGSSTGQQAPVGNWSSGGPNASSGGGAGRVVGDPLLESIKYVLAGVVNPLLCVLGLVGNIFSVVVLSRRRMQAAMTGTTVERSAYIGMIALAVSDILYCISALLESAQSLPRRP